MISYEEAIDIILSSSKRLDSIDIVELPELLNRVVSEDIYSDIDMPPFNKAAVDGFACRKEDLPGILKIIEEIPAGKFPQKTVGTKECALIMTGAPVPEGANCIVKIEDTEKIENDLVSVISKPKSDNICFKSEDIKAGEKVLSVGDLIRPQDIAVLASVGKWEVKVNKLPLIGLITTGDELVEPPVKPKPSQIRNSNTYQLMGQIKKIGFNVKYYGILSDELEITKKTISEVIAENDVLILTGGVSAGKYDYVPKVLQDLGFEIKVRSIAIQPGKPTVFAQKENKYVFGLPGNPVSSFVIFEIIVKPFLYNLCGHKYKPLVISLPMENDYIRNNAERMAWIPIEITEKGTVKTVEYHGSAHIFSYTKAHGIISIPIGKKEIKKGEIVYVRPI